jgi:hypothetical protein
MLGAERGEELRLARQRDSTIYVAASDVLPPQVDVMPHDVPP